MNYIDLEQNFFGRRSVLETLKKRVIDLKEGYRQNVAVLGPYSVGKSALLKHFYLNLDDNRIVTVYLDLSQKDFAYFFHKFTISLLYEYSKIKKLPLHDDLNVLCESVKYLIPNTIDVIKNLQKLFLSDKQEECFQGLLALPEVFTNETEQFCLMIIDEFQGVELFDIPDAFQLLGKKIMTQKKCLYVVSSSFPQLAKKILSEKLSLLFGNFEEIEVCSFLPLESQNLIVNNLKDIRMGVQLKNFLADYTAGYPLYINLICQELINLSAVHRQTEVYLPLLSQAVENTIFNRWGVISRHFELMVNDLCAGKCRFMPHVLISIANGKNKVIEIVAETKFAKSKVVQKINRLLELGIIQKNGIVYYFKDKLFKNWVKYVYQKRLKDVDLSLDKQRRQFKDDFQHMIEEYKMNSTRGFSDRIVELLHCFSDESFDLRGRKYKLPSFSDIELVKIKTDAGYVCDAIKASNEEDDWFIFPKKETVQDIDMNLILSHVRNRGVKADHCLIVSMSEMEDHIKIKALQERFWIWNENDVNELLTLFNKPFISL